MKKVQIYSTPSCSYCHMAKEFFKKNNVSYEDFDVAVNLEKRRDMVEKSGQMSVPVILIDDEIIVGFDKAKISKLLDVK